MQIDFENRVLFLALGSALLAQPHHLAQHLHVEAETLGLEELVADVAGERLLFLLQPFDLLDELTQLLLRRACSVVIPLLPVVTERRTLSAPSCRFKARDRAIQRNLVRA